MVPFLFYKNFRNFNGLISCEVRWEAGELHIDVAFISAPCCDAYGNMNGAYGKSACGVLSYAYADAQYADQVVAVTDNLVEFPACPIEISQEKAIYIILQILFCILCFQF